MSTKMEAFDAFLEENKVTVSIGGDYVGPGWWPLLRCVFLALKSSGWDGQAAQIKEKFGGLRIYIDGLAPQYDAIVDAAESVSASVCECCGRSGQRRSSSGWLKTRCEDCIDK